MREIKFRAWDGEYMMDNLDSINLEMVRESVYTEDGENTLPCIYMQYTGLHDKNGKEIYDGDIVMVCWHTNGHNELNGRMAKVEWAKAENGDCEVREMFQYFVFDMVEPSRGYYGEYINPFYYSVEVVGNIYENKELLTKQ